ncbi:serine/threonine protein phosphatase, putative [Eimeria necatrix]|uniref:Serine/threonine protein phosphatase, putative n=1 Tax=Eimeria necatrix TaxID=51315 RepID=U6MJZ7_9EIME|nr:serine/threonine protein phosphatase, putative [Eimeria necatrix]CDJ61980.1 serine/threonine protein phosphatase, putative [Eimeria necatrix]
MYSYYGGWLAPNIFFLGYSGVVNVGGLRIAGVSGIYNEQHYHLGHFEKPPYSESTSRSAYHVREFELLKLHCIEGHVDIMLSHDWPEGIYNYGDKQTEEPRILPKGPPLVRRVEEEISLDLDEL